MKRQTRLFCGLGLLAMALAFAPAALADDEVTLEGSFVWERNDGDRTGPLTAVMTPDGENEWKVAFHFIWEEEPHTYLGRATGTLGSGSLEGSAESDNPDHLLRFRFSGAFENGTFSGTHGFVQDDGSLKDGGSLTLSMPE